MFKTTPTTQTKRMLTIAAATTAAWVAMAAIPVAIETIGGVSIAASAWAQHKESDHKESDHKGPGDMEKAPAPNPNAGFLGAKFAMITDEIADEMKLDSQSGVIVVELVPDSPASAEDGLKVHDVIKQMDGKPVEDVQAFVKVMRETKPGQVMKFSVLRAGKPADVSITLGKRPAGMNQPPTTKPSDK